MKLLPDAVNLFATPRGAQKIQEYAQAARWEDLLYYGSMLHGVNALYSFMCYVGPLYAMWAWDRGVTATRSTIDPYPVIAALHRQFGGQRQALPGWRLHAPPPALPLAAPPPAPVGAFGLNPAQRLQQEQGIREHWTRGDIRAASVRNVTDFQVLSFVDFCALATQMFEYGLANPAAPPNLFFTHLTLDTHQTLQLPGNPHLIARGNYSLALSVESLAADAVTDWFTLYRASLYDGGIRIPFNVNGYTDYFRQSDWSFIFASLRSFIRDYFFTVVARVLRHGPPATFQPQPLAFPEDVRRQGQLLLRVEMQLRAVLDGTGRNVPGANFVPLTRADIARPIYWYIPWDMYRSAPRNEQEQYIDDQPRANDYVDSAGQPFNYNPFRVHRVGPVPWDGGANDREKEPQGAGLFMLGVHELLLFIVLRELDLDPAHVGGPYTFQRQDRRVQGGGFGFGGMRGGSDRNDPNWLGAPFHQFLVEFRLQWMPVVMMNEDVTCLYHDKTVDEEEVPPPGAPAPAVQFPVGLLPPGGMPDYLQRPVGMFGYHPQAGFSRTFVTTVQNIQLAAGAVQRRGDGIAYAGGLYDQNLALQLFNCNRNAEFLAGPLCQKRLFAPMVLYDEILRKLGRVAAHPLYYSRQLMLAATAQQLPAVGRMRYTATPMGMDNLIIAQTEWRAAWVNVRKVYSRFLADLGRYGVLLQAGGCSSVGKLDNLPHSLRRVCTYFPQLVASRNNCLFACLFHGAKSSVFSTWELGDADTTYDLMRKHCGIDLQEQISVEDIGRITRKYPLTIEVYALTANPPDGVGSGMISLINRSAHPLSECTVRVIFHKNHYYLVGRPEGLNFRRCGVCYKWMCLTDTFRRHLANCRRCPNCCQPCTGTSTHHCRRQQALYVGERQVIKRYELPTTYTAETNVYYADFETSTFSVSVERHVVYAAGIVGSEGSRIEKEPIIFYGLKALEQFTLLIYDLEGTLVMYNGSAFDYILLFHHLIASHPKWFDERVKDIVMKDNRVMAFTFGRLKCIDLYLFLRCSLKKACADLKVPAEFCKSEFDHRKLVDFDAMTRFEGEVRAYLRLDVLALQHCYQIFARDCWANFSCNINDFITLSHMAYNIWTNTLETTDEVFIPKPGEDEWFRRALFGGRCGPQKPSFYSTQAATIQKKLADSATNELTETEFNEITDYLVDLDVVSLYPTAMKQFRYPCGRFAIHDLPEQEKDYSPAAQYAIKRLNDQTDNRGAFYEVDIVPPRNILTPFLQERGPHDSLVYSLAPKTHQVYTGIELKEALRLGYKITKVHRYATFPSMRSLFSAFITKCFEVKKRSPKGSVSYLTAKLVMNAVSGKQSQRVIMTEHKFVTNTQEVREHLRNEKVIDVKILYGDDEASSGSFDDGALGERPPIGALIKKARKHALPSKCVYLGSWILGAARVWMSRIMRLVGGYNLPENMFYYTDTDSFKMHATTVKLLASQDGVIGKELGMMSDELSGGKIVRAIFLAPKSYIVEFVSAAPQHRLKWKVRCKGIPHDEGDIDVQDVHEGRYGGYHNMRYDLYSIAEDGKQGKLSSSALCITFEMFEAMLANTGQVHVQIDTLKRALCDVSYRRNIGIYTVRLDRTMNKTHWWSQNKRVLVQFPDGTDVSVPNGHSLDPMAPVDPPPAKPDVPVGPFTDADRGYPNGDDANILGASDSPIPEVFLDDMLIDTATPSCSTSSTAISNTVN